MLEMLNDMLELIYVADVETYDLLFMNTSGRKKFQIDKLDGLKCYRTLQGLEAPCPFCTNDRLTRDDVYSWEFTNPLTNCHYLLKDRLIDWEGRNARIEIAFDATESENEKIALKTALSAELLVMECAKMLYQAEEITDAMQSVLARVGDFLSAERAYIFDIRGNEMYNTYEWCAKGIQPQIGNLQGLSVSLIDGWLPRFKQHECFISEDVSTLKESDPNTFCVLAAQRISSLVTAPLEKDGKLVGYFGVDNPPAEKIRNISSLFHTLRFFLMTAMRRAEDEHLLTQLSYYDTLTGFYNRNRFIQDTSALSAYKGSFGLAYMDINGLKDMNDQRGHSYGDHVLFLCARIIAEEFDGGDFYRIGGDEFVAICRPIDEAAFLEKIARLKERFAQNIEYSAAIGCQWTANLEDIQALISKADVMMYENKKQHYLENPPSKRYRQWDK